MFSLYPRLDYSNKNRNKMKRKKLRKYLVTNSPCCYGGFNSQEYFQFKGVLRQVMTDDPPFDGY
jgi:hypothetical protein